MCACAAWGAGYWLDFNSLVLTVAGVSPNGTVPAFRLATAVGNLSITALPSGNLTSYDGTSAPCNASVVVAVGSWGDAVCDVALNVFSHRAVEVAFSRPATLFDLGPGVPVPYILQYTPFVDWRAQVRALARVQRRGGRRRATKAVEAHAPWRTQPVTGCLLLPLPETSSPCAGRSCQVFETPVICFALGGRGGGLQPILVP